MGSEGVERDPRRFLPQPFDAPDTALLTKIRSDAARREDVRVARPARCLPQSGCRTSTLEQVNATADRETPRQHADLLSQRDINSTGSGLATPLARGGNPFNLLRIANTNGRSGSAGWGHGAGTPLKLCDWWVRYITKPGQIVLDRSQAFPRWVSRL